MLQYPRLLQSPVIPENDLTDNASLTLARDKQQFNAGNELLHTKAFTKCVLPECITLDNASSDLLRRLLEVNPQHRLRSLMALERIAMYKGFSFEDVQQKKVCFFIAA